MSDRELMQQALEALIGWSRAECPEEYTDIVISKLRTALAKQDEIESLRQRVKELEREVSELEDDNEIAVARCVKAESELAALKAGQGEPYLFENYWNGEDITYDKHRKDADSVALYTSAPAIPEGWVIVPVDPTDTMVQAGLKLMNWDASVSEIWEALLAAAPKPSQQAAHMPVKTYCGGKPNYCKESE